MIPDSTDPTAGRFVDSGHTQTSDRTRAAAHTTLPAMALVPAQADDRAVLAVLAALYVAVVFRVVGFLGGLTWLALLLGFGTGWLGELSQSGMLVALFGAPLAFGLVRWRAHRLRHRPAPPRAPRKKLRERLRRRGRRSEPEVPWSQRLERIELAVEPLINGNGASAVPRTVTEQGASIVAGSLQSETTGGPDSPTPSPKENLTWDSK